MESVMFFFLEQGGLYFHFYWTLQIMQPVLLSSLLWKRVSQEKKNHRSIHKWIHHIPHLSFICMTSRPIYFKNTHVCAFKWKSEIALSRHSIFMEQLYVCLYLCSYQVGN